MAGAAEWQHEAAGPQHPPLRRQLRRPSRHAAVELEGRLPAAEHHVSPTALKSLYRKRLLRHVLAEMDEANSAADLAKRVDVLDAISWLHLAWAGVSEDCVRKCFARCGFREPGTAAAEPGTAAAEPGTAAAEPDAASQVLLGTVAWQDYVAMDDAIHAAAVHDDDWEAALVAKAKGETVEESEEEEEEEERPVRKLPTARAALDSVRDIVGIALSTSDYRTFWRATASARRLLPSRPLVASSVARTH